MNMYDFCDVANSEIAGCRDRDTTVVSPIKSGVNLVLYAVGIAAIIMIIYSGVQYVTSAGDAGKTQKAKMTLIYAIVGLVVAILAYAIVNFVVGRL